MKFLRENAAVVFLAVVALILLFFTIRLQSLVRSTGIAGDASPGGVRALREGLAQVIAPDTLTPSTLPFQKSTPPCSHWERRSMAPA
jgi:hypothetical protein